MPYFHAQEVSSCSPDSLRQTTASASFTGANRNTIKAHLKVLVQKRMLTQVGKGKGTWYRL